MLASGLALLNLLWALTVLVGLPGPWLILASTLLAVYVQSLWLAPGAAWLVGLPVMVVAAGLALLSEAVEFVGSYVGARHGGGTRRGAIGALVGSFVGGLVGAVVLWWIPIVSALAGACVGAALGTIVVEMRYGMLLRPAVTAGAGAGVGRFIALVGKFAVTLLMWLVVTIASFWP